ncbi:MAG: tetratricopeptide repeat protein [Caldilineaceae bacterium]
MTISTGHQVIQSSSHQVIESPTPPVTPHNLPAQRTPFIGRVAELGELMRLLLTEDECRLLTLVGPGGMGKTRLALKVAEQVVALPAAQQPFQDGIFFVALETINDEDGWVSAVIVAVSAQNRFPVQGDAPLAKQLFQYLRNKTLLLVLDNFEQLLRAAPLLSDLLLAAPKVKLLVTSREGLGLQEAWFYPLAGLTMPGGAASPPRGQTEYDAALLFAQCARRARPDFALDRERDAVLRICTLVDGTPLAIELAAAWLKGLNCTQIAQEVAQGLDILTARYQNMPARQRSMRVVLEHSWALLTAAERDALARLAIFRGQFSQAAANVVTGTTLFTLATLADKALLRLTATGHYQLHELTRQYAEERLGDDAKVAVRNAHARYYADLLARQKPHLFTRTFEQVWTAMGAELDNIRHAWLWLIESAGAGRTDLPLPALVRQMAELLIAYHLYQLLWLPGQALFDHACQLLTAAGWGTPKEAIVGEAIADENSRRAVLLRLQLNAGHFQLEMGHYPASLALAEQLLPLCRQISGAEDLFRALLLYGHTQVRRGQRVEAIPAFEEALTLAQQLPLPRYRAEALIGLGMIASADGRYGDAQVYYLQGLAVCREMGYQPWIARIMTNLGFNYLRQNEPRQAQPYLEQALTLAQEAGDQFAVMINNTNLGGVQRRLRNYQAAVEYHQRSLTMARTMGEERWIANNLNGLANTYLEMGNPTAAEGALYEALRVGHQIDSKPDALTSVGLLGHLFAHRGQLEAAIRALLFVDQHPATAANDKAHNQQLLTELRSELPAALFAQAAGWVATQTLDDVARWLLHGVSLPPLSKVTT